MIEFRRRIFSLGFVLLAIPSIGIAMLGEPGWVQSAVYQSSVVLAFAFLGLRGLTDFVSESHHGKLMAGFLLAVTMAGVFPVCVELNAAAFLGRASAEFDTWHLLPLFAVIHEVIYVVLCGAITAVACAIIGIVGALKRTRSTNPT